MRKEYDLKKMKLRDNPYASKLKKSVTIRLDGDIISYFKEMSEETGIAYQTLINEYLKDCKQRKLKIKTVWKKAV